MDREKEERYITRCMEWIARRKARLDQWEKQYQDAYPHMSSELNLVRLENIEAWKLAIEVHEYELGGFIKDYIDSLEEE